MLKKLSIVILLIFLSGCWGKVDLEDVSIVSGVSVDKTESDEFEVTIQKIIPLAIIENDPQAFLTRSSSGLTIFETIRDFISILGQKQLWEHVDIFVISSEIAENNMLTVTDFFNRDHEPRPNMLCIVSRGPAKDILNTKSDMDPIPTVAVRQSLESQEDLSKAPYVELRTLMRLISDPYQDAYLPIIQKNEDDFTVLGTAIFKGDKMIGELTAVETRSMLRILGEVKGGLQVINLAPEDKDHPQYASLEIKKSKSDIEAKIKENNPKIIINIKEEGVIGDINQPMELNRHSIKEIETIYAETVKKEIEQMIDKIQKDYKSNVLNFASAVRRGDRQYWQENKEQWEEIYPTLEVEVEVETKIVHSQLKQSR